MDVQDTLRELVDGQHELFIAITDVARRQDRMEGQMTKLATNFNVLSRELVDLKDYTYAGFDTMNYRFDRLEDRVDHLEASLSRLG